MNANCLRSTCRRRGYIGAAILLGVLALGGLASAPSSSHDIATSKLREGNALFEQKQYEAALARYFKARARSPSRRDDRIGIGFRCVRTLERP